MHGSRVMIDAKAQADLGIRMKGISPL